MSQRPVRIGMVAAMTFATVAAAVPAHAQYTETANGYYVTGDYTINSGAAGGNLFVGKDPGTFATLPGTITLNIETGAVITYGGGVYPDGNSYFGSYVFGNHRINMSGGSVEYFQSRDTSILSIGGGNITDAFAHDSSTMNISGGSFSYANGYDSSTVNISGGNLERSFGYNNSTLNITGGNFVEFAGLGNSTVNISGGNFSYAGGNVNSTTNISGGTFTRGFWLNTGSTANFVGTGLSFAYQSYGNNNPLGQYADFFQISGTFQGEARTYDLYIRNHEGAGGIPNSTQRQFNLIDAAVVVPEANTFILALPALGIVGAVVIKRRKKCTGRGNGSLA